MPAVRRILSSIRPACFVFIILACLATACAPTMPPARPTPTLILATATPAATAALAPTATVAATAITAATTPTAGDQASVLEAVMQQLYQSGRFVGSVLVAQNGHVILSKGYGLADRSNNIPNTPQTKFRLYQVTMQFTAMAIMLLQQRGKLSVQDNICQYLPDCPSAWEPVTIHHLLTHTSGIVDTWNIHARGSLTSTLPLERMITATKTLPLAFQPGAQFQFDNMGYILLGKIIEAVSGQTYQAFLSQNIFGPLGMTNTDYDDNRADVAVGYVGPGLLADPVNAWVPFSAGGLDSTVGDVYLWDQALYTDKLVPQKVLDSIFTPYLSDTDYAGSFSYGYGWVIGNNNNRRVFFHESVLVGFMSVIMHYPDDKATIIVLMNAEPESPIAYNTADSLAQKLFAR